MVYHDNKGSDGWDIWIRVAAICAATIYILIPAFWVAVRLAQKPGFVFHTELLTDFFSRFWYIGVLTGGLLVVLSSTRTEPRVRVAVTLVGVGVVLISYIFGIIGATFATPS